MELIPIYIKPAPKTIVTNSNVYIEDIAKIYCSNTSIEKSIKKMKLTTISQKENQKIIYSIMYLIDKIMKKYPQLQIINLGETDFIVEYLKPQKKSILWEYIKAAFVCLILFFGSGFTIMTFNSDVDVANLFDKVNKLLLGTEHGHNVIEISYSIGIGVGIILFFNHFSRKKLKSELTPIQIEMRSYEAEMNKAFIKDADRENKTKDI